MAGQGGQTRCNDRCGCPVPCPGGTSCCASREIASSGGDDSSMEHMRCSCGEHCGCNPCMCEKVPASGVGRDFCKCSDSCACAACKA
ncbi:hypothetical protein Sjap_009708 [Stephania japonica]|uniref:Metallothionein n=1 Tax=Stephania japonica TaxID=461633 RepID=A0AAP0P6G6_9MAGN